MLNQIHILENNFQQILQQMWMFLEQPCCEPISTGTASSFVKQYAVRNLWGNGSSLHHRFCADGSLDPSKVRGKLVLCELGGWGADSVVKGIGGKGTILESAQYLDAAQIFMAPATMINATVSDAVNNYIHSTK